MRRGHRGAALLTAMITVALVASIAAAALWRQWRGVEVEAAERARVQSASILTGALDWGRLILQGDLNEDRRKSTLVDHLGEPWSVPLAEARLSTFLAAGESSSGVDLEAFLSGQISDLQSRLNVMNLVSNDPVGALARFSRLFDLLRLPARELAQLQRALTRAQGAMLGEHADDGAPLLPARVEQLAWLGLRPGTLAALQPYITLLPLQDGEATPVNLNTAAAEVIHAAVPPLDLAAAQRLVALRGQDYFQSSQHAMEQIGVTGANLDWASASSAFFEIRGRLRLDDVAMEEVAVVQRGVVARNRYGAHVLWRTRTALSAPESG